MTYACRLCILKYGLRGSDLQNLPQTLHELVRHLRDVHGITITAVNRETYEIDVPGNETDDDLDD